jgi:hypothetical protein
MTLWGKKQFTCAVCGATDSYPVLVSTNSFGHQDLDWRMAGMAREAYQRTILCCTGCGYCALDLSECPPSVITAVSSPAYRDFLSEEDLPTLARHWACRSLVQEWGGDVGGAGVSALRAAWACDDDDHTAGAERFRSRALELFREAQREGASFARDRASEQLLLLDLLRRTGRFEEVIQSCQKLDVSELLPELHAIVLFQRVLAERQDRRAYRTNHAEEYVEAPDSWEPPAPDAEDWFDLW